MQRAHEAGHDVEQAVRLLVTPNRVSGNPATELRARLTAALDVSRPAWVQPPAPEHRAAADGLPRRVGGWQRSVR